MKTGISRSIPEKWKGVRGGEDRSLVPVLPLAHIMLRPWDGKFGNLGIRIDGGVSSLETQAGTIMSDDSGAAEIEIPDRLMNIIDLDQDYAEPPPSEMK
ncbi:hypothetical protein AVEN_153407-1 [Araneus ventricosus]|uniref:Uncharacterized protein n=1 Tax=Araneus ventricosus TaxID=182803 RepID=A0A4Y2E7T9_ARAVE|nr:hypothetical protein AVEN_153407-1 [Araneus ventricosus]